MVSFIRCARACSSLSFREGGPKNPARPHMGRKCLVLSVECGVREKGLELMQYGGQGEVREDALATLPAECFTFVSGLAEKLGERLGEGLGIEGGDDAARG